MTTPAERRDVPEGAPESLMLDLLRRVEQIDGLDVAEDELLKHRRTKGARWAIDAAYAAGRTAGPLTVPLNNEPNAPSLRQVRDLGRIQWVGYIDATEEDADIRNDPRYVAARRAADTVPLLVAALDRLGVLPADSAAPEWPPATAWPDSYRRLVLGQE